MRVRIGSEIIDVPDEVDPDDYIERYVASGKARHLEETDVDLAKVLTERFITHQKWKENKRG